MLQGYNSSKNFHHSCFPFLSNLIQFIYYVWEKTLALKTWWGWIYYFTITSSFFKTRWGRWRIGSVSPAMDHDSWTCPSPVVNNFEICELCSFKKLKEKLRPSSLKVSNQSRTPSFYWGFNHSSFSCNFYWMKVKLEWMELSATISNSCLAETVMYYKQQCSKILLSININFKRIEWNFQRRRISETFGNVDEDHVRASDKQIWSWVRVFEGTGWGYDCYG